MTTATDHQHRCVNANCKNVAPCSEQHDASLPLERRACNLHIVKVSGSDACRWCDGTGTFAKACYWTHVEWVTCTMCGGTGAR